MDNEHNSRQGPQANAKMLPQYLFAGALRSRPQHVVGLSAAFVCNISVRLDSTVSQLSYCSHSNTRLVEIRSGICNITSRFFWEGNRKHGFSTSLWNGGAC